ncbi:hypothetical protein ABID21_000745 [Pseudorhizobium tarimense]|uniref:Uncharacterized protein n=1 Tax=Pseudorhizobium tarimense TaxID=1079109 RepID=A0ABV2H280_9HYPH|nr:hypothetical protein [Pseudorhizobium tarimense]MCJ8517742.1 hypothetical protein [Pseudorhizobium tarimense]
MNTVRTALYEAIAAALPIAIIYFAGWAYLVKYLAEFGIDATQVSIALSTVLAYAFVPLKSGGVIMYCAVALFVIGYLVTTRVHKTVKRLSFIFAIVGLALFLFVIDDAAARAAAKMAKHVWNGQKSISIPVLNQPATNDAASIFQTCSKERRLRQIIGLTDEMYVLCRDAYFPCSYALMFAINKEGRIIYLLNGGGDWSMRIARTSLLAMITVGLAVDAFAQQQQQATPQGSELGQQDPGFQSIPVWSETLLLVEGPYKLKGSFGVFGYVIARNAGKVTFKSCNAETIEVDESVLEMTRDGCEYQAPEKDNAITVACADLPPAWGKAASDVLANVTSDKIGSVYAATSDGKAERIASPDNYLAMATIDEVKAIQPCGGVLTGFSGTGVPVTGIVAVEPTER